MKREFPEVFVIILPRNTGFAYGANIGVRAAVGKYIATLNNDAIADPDWLRELVRAAESNPHAGMFASKIYLGLDKKIIDSVGCSLYPDGASRGRGRMEEDHGQFNKEEEVLFPSACAALYRTDMMRALCGFDSDFFIYCDDTDLGLRGRLIGWKCLYVPVAIVHHHYSQSTGAYSPLKAFLVERNRVWVAIKNFPSYYLIRSIPYTIWRFIHHGYGVIVGRGAASKSDSLWGTIVAVLRAYICTLFSIRKMFGKRREVKSTVRIGPDEVRLWFTRFSMSAREIAWKD